MKTMRWWICLLAIVACTTSTRAQILDVKAAADSLILLFEDMEEEDRSTTFIQTFSKSVIVDIQVTHDFVEAINDYALSQNDTILMSSSEVLFSEIHWRNGEYEEATIHALSAVDLAGSTQRFLSVKAQGLMTLGSIQFFVGDAIKAVDYYNEAAAVFEAEGNIQAYVSVMSNIGAVYADYGDREKESASLDSALVYLSKVIDMKEQAQYNFYLSALGNSGYIYRAKKEYEEALRFFDLWELEEAHTPNVTAKANQYINIGDVHMELGDYTKAEEYFRQGLAYALEINLKQRVAEYYLDLADLMERQSNYEQAYHYSKQGRHLNDSLFNIEKVNAINELEAKYESARKEQEIQEANAIIDKNERFQLFLSIVIAIILVFGVAAFVMLRHRFALKQELLLQETDNLRLQINALIGKHTPQLEVSLTDINKSLKETLSDRELEVLEVALTDKNNMEMAEHLNVSVNTVKYHLKKIYAKLGVTNRNEAISFTIKASSN